MASEYELKLINRGIGDLGETFDDYMKANNDRLDRMDHKVDKISTFMNDVGHGSALSKSSYQSPYAKAFNSYLRRGPGTPEEEEVRGLQADEAKAMSVHDDPGGGYLIPHEMYDRIIEKVRESSPIRQLATVEEISASSLDVPAEGDDFESGWVGETQARPETTSGTFNMHEIPLHEVYAQPLITQKLLDDASMDVESWVNRKIGMRFGRDEATAFVTGDGVKKPRGFLTYPDGTAYKQIQRTTTAAAGVIGYDDLVGVTGSLKAAYRANAVWLMNRTTAATVMKIKDSQGRPLWIESMKEGQPAILLGYPVRLAEDMPDVVTNALSIAFGDFSAGYMIVDRPGIRILRDPYTSKPYVKIYSTKRVGGDVVDFDAIKLLEIQ